MQTTLLSSPPGRLWVAHAWESLASVVVDIVVGVVVAVDDAVAGDADVVVVVVVAVDAGLLDQKELHKGHLPLRLSGPTGHEASAGVVVVVVVAEDAIAVAAVVVAAATADFLGRIGSRRRQQRRDSL